MSKDTLEIKYSLTTVLLKRLIALARHHTYIDTILSFSKQKTKILNSLQTLEALSYVGIDTTITGRRDQRSSENAYHKREINDYFNAFKFLREQATKKTPLSLELLSQIHKRVSPGSQGGELRKQQTYVVRIPDRKVLHTPPKPSDIPHAINALLVWNDQQKNTDAVITSAIVHHQIAFIHPFLDGNGRVARLIASYLMFLGGYAIDHILICSDRFFLKNRALYYEELVHANKDSNYNRWIEFIAEAWVESYSRIAKLANNIHKRKKTARQLSLEQEKLMNLYREIGGRTVASAKSNSGIPSLSKDVFIIMANAKDDPALVDVHRAFKEVCKKRGLNAFQVEDIEDIYKITDKIMESIDSSLFVIADLTHERPNVYYESGYAHGIEKRVIFTAWAGTKVHFDIKIFNVIFYPNITTLKSKLTSKIKTILKNLP
jgi:Fic family protein